MARQFDGNVANYLSSSLNYDLPADWTILIRIKNLVANADHQIFLGRKGGDGNGWAIGRDSGGSLTIWAFGGSGAVSVGIIPAGNGSFDAIAITRASSGSVGTFYRNSSTPLGTATINTAATSGAGLFVGCMNNAGSPAFPAKCEEAEIAIFPRVLNSTELGQWFAGESPSLYSTGLQHYWKLDAVRASEPPATVGETATVGGVALTEVGTIGSTTHPAMDYGAGGTDATAPGATVTGTGTISAGSASGGGVATGSFTFPAGENNTHSGSMSGVAVNWAWHSGGAVGAASVITNGTGTMTTSGMTITGLPVGQGYGFARSADGSVVCYREGTVS